MDRLRYFGSSRFFQLVDHRNFRVMILLAGAMETIMFRMVRATILYLVMRVSTRLLVAQVMIFLSVDQAVETELRTSNQVRT